MNGFQQPELAEVARKRRMAELLMQSQMPQGQMVSGRYVPPAFTQQLASALNLYKGGKLTKEADEQERSMAEALQQKREGWIGEMPTATDNTSMAGPAIPQTPTAQDYMAWVLKGHQIDPQAAQRGMQLANMQLNREAQAEARTQQEQLRRDQMAQQQSQAEQQRALQIELAQMRNQQGQQGRGDYFVPVQTSEGIRILNSRTGQLNMPQGQAGPLMPPSADPRLQGELAQAKTTATETAKRQVEGKFEAPEAIAKGEEALRLVDDLLKSPGFKQAVGASRMVGIQNIPGTSAKDFDIRLDQLKGQQFLQAFESLKGGGQITEVEGKKATDAISRMNASASEKEFETAAREFQDVIRRGIDRAKQKGGTPAPAAPKRIRFDAQGNMIQ
jgi:hypothetical protein